MTMPPINCQIDTSHVDGAVIIAIDGELDLASAPRLVEIADGVPRGLEPIILNLSSVTFMDSSGVRALLDVGRIANDKGRRLALLRPAVAVTRVLDLVNLRPQFTEVEALDGDILLALKDGSQPDG